VNQVLESSANIAMHEIRGRCRLARDCDEVPLVWANEARLAQVFLNLVLNAAQAISRGSPMNNEIRLTTRSEGGMVTVQVRDTGEGIAPEIRARVFDPFFTTKAPGVGTGLGLSIAHRIVTSMGGDLTFESEPGRGSTFTVRLSSADRPARSAAPQAAPLPGARGSRARILVIDDEPTIARAVTRLLRPAHEAEGLTNPDEAIARVTGGERFDLILCDLTMPERSGMDVYEAIARVDPGQARRMLFMTGGALGSATSAFVAERPDRVVYKPFTIDELLLRIGAALALLQESDPGG
jgi:CheY-like chemotaxis protein